MNFQSGELIFNLTNDKMEISYIPYKDALDIDDEQCLSNNI